MRVKGSIYPDQKSLEVGDLLCARGADSYILKAADADRALSRCYPTSGPEWEAAKAAFIEHASKDPAATPGARRAAERLTTMTYEQFLGEYLGAEPRGPTEEILKAKHATTPFATGHVGIVTIKEGGQCYVVDAAAESEERPKGVDEAPYEEWRDYDKPVYVWQARLRNVPPGFPAKVAATARKYVGRPYEFFNLKLDDPNAFYCSKLIWLAVYEASGGTIALDGNPDPDRGFWFTPRDILEKCKKYVERVFSPEPFRGSLRRAITTIPESARDQILDLLPRWGLVTEQQWVVMAKKGREAEVFGLISGLGLAGVQRLNLIGAVAVTATPRQLSSVWESDAWDSIYPVPEQMRDVYIQIVKGIEIATADPRCAVLNLSLGPPAPMEFDELEPVNVATKIAADNHNRVIVFAAGNEGPHEDTLNPWSAAPWVIGVGAASKDGCRLAECSSRGRRLDPLYRPTVVAPGVDMLVPHPPYIPKNPAQQEAEKRTDFSQMVPPDERSSYTVVSGTSFAAAEVSRVAAQVWHYLTKLISDEQKRAGGQPLAPPDSFARQYGHSQARKGDERVTSRRLAGALLQDADGLSTVVYPIDLSPVIIKQIIMDMAIPMPGYQPHEVGAGFVTPELAEQYFGAFGGVEPDLCRIKVL